jgi:hypothetical protein
LIEKQNKPEDDIEALIESQKYVMFTDKQYSQHMQDLVPKRVPFINFDTKLPKFYLKQKAKDSPTKSRENLMRYRNKLKELNKLEEKTYLGKTLDESKIKKSNEKSSLWVQ